MFQKFSLNQKTTKNIEMIFDCAFLQYSRVEDGNQVWNKRRGAIQQKLWNNEDKFAAAALGYGQLEKMMPFDWQNAKMH